MVAMANHGFAGEIRERRSTNTAGFAHGWGSIVQVVFDLFVSARGG